MGAADAPGMPSRELNGNEASPCINRSSPNSSSGTAAIDARELGHRTGSIVERTSLCLSLISGCRQDTGDAGVAPSLGLELSDTCVQDCQGLFCLLTAEAQRRHEPDDVTFVPGEIREQTTLQAAP